MNIHRTIEAATLLKQQLKIELANEDGELSDDDKRAIADTIEGELPLDQVLRDAVLTIANDEIFITGCRAEEARLAERRRRLERRIERLRGSIEQAMAIAEWPKLDMDIGSVSLSKAAPRVEVDDESQIPSQFFKRQDPVLDKAGLGKVLKERHRALAAATAIRTEALRNGEVRRIDLEYPAIPGAHLETDGTTLTIRRK